MNIKSNAAALIALVLASSAKAAFLDDVLKPQAPPAAGADPAIPIIPTGTGTGTATTATIPNTATSPTVPTSSVITTPPTNQTTTITTTPLVPTTGANTTSKLPSSTTLSVTPTATSLISPTPTQTSKDSGSSTQLATAGIVVGAVVVAAAIGIWVFRKWKLSVRHPPHFAWLPYLSSDTTEQCSLTNA